MQNVEFRTMYGNIPLKKKKGTASIISSFGIPFHRETVTTSMPGNLLWTPTTCCLSIGGH